MLPKSFVIASARAPFGAPPPPRPWKYASCRIIEFVAISSSRFKPLIMKTGALAKSSSANCVPIALSRFTAPT
jgi:hypothetical protein